MSARRTAFTVTELLVVIAIIGVLAALLLPAIQMAREAARRAQCGKNMAECAKAISSYANAKQFLPASRSVLPNSSPAVFLNWVFPILSDLEQVSLHDQLRAGPPVPSQLPPMPILMCPSQGRIEFDRPVSAAYSVYPEAPVSYAVNGGRLNRIVNPATDPWHNFDWLANGVFVDKGPLPAAATSQRQDKMQISDIKDGVSTTIMLCENPNLQSWLVAEREQHSQVLWFNPDVSPPAIIGFNQEAKGPTKVAPTTFDADPRYARPASWHPNGFQIAMCDGSIQWMADTTAYKVYAVLMSSNGERANDPGSGALGTYANASPQWQSPTKWNTSTPPQRIPNTGNTPASNDYPGTTFQ
jgi:prepilin-type N-terminal cleavage/methylation domain-containing protein